MSQVRARSARQVLEECRGLVELPLRDAIGGLPPSIRLIVGYHLGWHDELGRPAAACGGKAIRPALALLSAEAVGADPGTALPAAVAVELVHNFSLLHDDVMDEDLTRRHRPTAWATFGIPAAILAGDALLNLAFQVLAGSSRPAAATRILSSALSRLVDGQSADLGLSARSAASIQECVDTAAAKTGALLGCACALGGIFAGGSPGQVEYLSGFGEQLGLVFQHVDDLLGIWGNPDVTGKPVHSDLANRKKSLPVTAALVSGTPAARELAALYGADRPLAGDELVRAATLVEAAGGRRWSEAKADEHLEAAVRLVVAAGFAGSAAGELLNLARLVASRDH